VRPQGRVCVTRVVRDEFDVVVCVALLRWCGVARRGSFRRDGTQMSRSLHCGVVGCVGVGSVEDGCVGSACEEDGCVDAGRVALLRFVTRGLALGRPPLCRLVGGLGNSCRLVGEPVRVFLFRTTSRWGRNFGSLSERDLKKRTAGGLR